MEKKGCQRKKVGKSSKNMEISENLLIFAAEIKTVAYENNIVVRKHPPYVKWPKPK